VGEKRARWKDEGWETTPRKVKRDRVEGRRVRCEDGRTRKDEGGEGRRGTTEEGREGNEGE
jgi:hypothetical protein